MNQEIFKKIELDATTLSLDFWNSEAQIKSYCEGILNHNNDNKYKVEIQFKASEAYVLSPSPMQYLIVLPKTELITDPDIKLKNIIARTVFLRHELAHILFTDSKIHEQVLNNKVLFNAFEDARIENHYSKKYKGTYRLFKAMVKNIHGQLSEGNVFNDMNINDFALYCRLREKEIIPNIKNISVQTGMEAIYQKYRYIFHNDYQTLIDGVKKIIEEFDAIEQDKKQQQQEQQKQSEESEKKESEEEAFLKDLIDSEESQPEESESPQIEQENDSGLNTQADQQEDSDEKESQEETSGESEEESDLNNDDSEGEQNDSDSGEENQDESENNSGEDSDDMDNFDSAAESDSNDEQQEQNDITKDYNPSTENAQEEKDQLEEAIDELFDDQEEKEQELKIDNFDYSKLLKDISSIKNDFDLDSYNFDPDDFKEATTIDFYKIARYISKTHRNTNNRYRSGGNFIKPDANIIYNAIVSKHKKTIVETINYLKLKLKIRSKDKSLYNQVDGKLDQRNLKELFVNKDMPEVFYRTVKTIKTDSEFYLLIDFSGSMDNFQRTDAIVTAIAMVEICKALNINYDISLFSNEYSGRFTANSEENILKIKQILINNKINQDQIRTWQRSTRSFNLEVSYKKADVVYKIKSIKEKHSVFTENLLASIIDTHLLGGGTPEFECFLSLVKQNKHSRNIKKNIFIINDGMINPIREIMALDSNTKIYNANSYLPLEIYIEENFYRNTDKQRINNLVISKLKKMLDATHSTYKNNNIGWEYNFANNTYSQAMYDVLASNEIFSNPDKYLFMVENAYFVDNYNKYYIVNYNAVFNGMQKYFIIDSIKAESVFLYKKAIEEIKKYNFNVYGFGIRSNYGKQYLDENFQCFKNSAEIETSLATKIREIF